MTTIENAIAEAYNKQANDLAALKKFVLDFFGVIRVLLGLSAICGDGFNLFVLYVFGAAATMVRT